MNHKVYLRYHLPGDRGVVLFPNITTVKGLSPVFAINEDSHNIYVASWERTHTGYTATIRLYQGDKGQRHYVMATHNVPADDMPDSKHHIYGLLWQFLLDCSDLTPGHMFTSFAMSKDGTLEMCPEQDHCVFEAPASKVIQ